LLDEYARWDRLAASIANETDEPDLTADQRAGALAAVSFLRDRFGESWLRQVYDQSHPFMELVGNRAPWTRVRMADLADAIHRVELLNGGRRLTDRYARSGQESGALFELDLAASALRTGLLVELEPQTQAGRTCDMAVSQAHGRGATTAFVEVQSVQDFADETKRAMDVTERLVPMVAWAMLGRELLGEIFRIPDDVELDQLLPITNEFFRRCESSSEPEHVAIDDVMDLWAVPIGHPARANLVAAGVPDRFRSPAPDDPLRRVLRAVRSKIGQLPTLAAGLIALRPPRLLFLNPNHLPYIVSAVKQAVATSPQISAVALVDWAYRATATPDEVRREMAGALVIHHPDRHIFVREAVLIENPVRAFRAADQVIHRLL